MEKRGMGIPMCSTIDFDGTIKEKGGRYIAYCNQLPMSAFGATEQEAGDNIIKALSLYMRTHNELGQLPDIIKRYDLKVEVDYTVKNQRFRAKCPVPA